MQSRYINSQNREFLSGNNLSRIHSFNKRLSLPSEMRKYELFVLINIIVHDFTNRDHSA